MKVGRHAIEVSNRGKVFFPESGITKGDLIDYYHEISKVMLPHMELYPVSLQRFPDGLEGEGFYNKGAPNYFPDWIDKVHFPKREGARSTPRSSTALPCWSTWPTRRRSPSTATWLRKDDLEKPDKMIYDLDFPEGTEDYSAVRQVALDLHGVLEEIELISFVQTTGSQGYHVVVPLRREEDFDVVRDFATDVAKVLVRRNADRYTLEHRKTNRKGRIFLDILRNSYGATTVAPYSVRTLTGAPVATPITLDELQDGAEPRDWTLESIHRRLGQKEDPWSGIMQYAQSIRGKRQKLRTLTE